MSKHHIFIAIWLGCMLVGITHIASVEHVNGPLAALLAIASFISFACACLTSE